MELRKLVEGSGLRPNVIYERAGYAREHYYKILSKKSVSVEELTRISSAVGIRPGDVLPNSLGELKPMLPLIEELKKFSPDAAPRLLLVLRSLREFVSDTWLTMGELPIAVRPEMTRMPTFDEEAGARTDEPAAVNPYASVNGGPDDQRRYRHQADRGAGSSRKAK